VSGITGLKNVLLANPYFRLLPKGETGLRGGVQRKSEGQKQLGRGISLAKKKIWGRKERGAIDCTRVCVEVLRPCYRWVKEAGVVVNRKGPGRPGRGSNILSPLISPDFE